MRVAGLKSIRDAPAGPLGSACPPKSSGKSSELIQASSVFVRMQASVGGDRPLLRTRLGRVSWAVPALASPGPSGSARGAPAHSGRALDQS